MKTLIRTLFFAVVLTAVILPQKKISVSLDGKQWKGELHSAQVTKLFGKSFLKLHFVSGREELSLELDMANINGKNEVLLTYKPMKRLSDPSPAFTVSYFENEVNKWSASSGTLEVESHDQTKNLISGELDVKMEKKGSGGDNKPVKTLKVNFSNIKYLE